MDHNPWIGEKMPKAWEQAIHILSDNDWHGLSFVSNHMAASADILPTTAKGIIYAAIRSGAIERRGRYMHRRKRTSNHDEREIRLHPDGLPYPWHPDDR